MPRSSVNKASLPFGPCLPLIKDIIRLPDITDDELEKFTNLKKRKTTLLVTDRVEEDISLEEEKERPVCYHHYKVNNEHLASLSLSL